MPEPGDQDAMVTVERDSVEDEALSFCDLPLDLERSKVSNKETKHAATDDFEFAPRSSLLFSDSVGMCVAEDVISGGFLLPYRPSVSSETGGLLHPPEMPTPARTRSLDLSRSQSLDRRSWCFTNSSRGSSSSSRSSGVSPRRLSTDSGWLFSMESPRPAANDSFRPMVPAKKEETTKMGFFRLGLMKTPEIQLGDLRQRLMKREEMGRSQRFLSSSPSLTSSSSLSSSWKVFRRLDCKCSAVEIVSSALNGEWRRGSEGRDGEENMKTRLLREKSETSRLRTFKWLNELPMQGGGRRDDDSFESILR